MEHYSGEGAGQVLPAELQSVEGFALRLERHVLPEGQDVFRLAEAGELPGEGPVLPAEGPVLPADEPVLLAEGPVLPADEPVLPADEPVLPADEPHGDGEVHPVNAIEGSQ